MVGLMRISAGVKNREDPRLLRLPQLFRRRPVPSHARVGTLDPVSSSTHDANAGHRPSTEPAETEPEHQRCYYLRTCSDERSVRSYRFGRIYANRPALVSVARCCGVEVSTSGSIEMLIPLSLASKQDECCRGNWRG
jgi:hypothetical protein